MSIQSIDRRIFSAATTVAIFILLAKIATFGKEVLIARQFGTHDELDAFLIAYLLPSFAISVIAGAFQFVFIPVYVRVEEHDGLQAARRFFSNASILGLFLLVCVSIIILGLSPYILPIIASGFDPEKLHLTRSLFYFLMPMLIISGWVMICAATLNAQEKFALAAVSPGIMPFTVSAFLLLAGIWGIYAIAAGSLAGVAIEAVVIGWGLKRTGFMLLPRWYGMTLETKTVIQQYFPMIAATFLMSGTILVDQSMAAMLVPGSVAALNYGGKIVGLVSNLLTVALGTAILPSFSKMVSREDWRNITKTLRRFTSLIFLGAIPIMIILMYSSDLLIQLVFQRGEFTADNSHLISSIQWYYAMQIPFYITGVVGGRLLVAMSMSKTILMITALNLMSNIIFNILLMRFMGVAGIALSTSLMYLVSCILIFSTLYLEIKKRRIGGISMPTITV